MTASAQPPPGSSGPQLPDLAAWLQRLEAAHPQRVELGLERVAAVGERLGVREPDAWVITVGGTNGKGSVGRALEALFAGAGWSTALYSSPHFHRFNERVRLRGTEADDSALVQALERVEVARAELGSRLTYFEHTTLAALDCFLRSGAAVWILEVGLGGRLDAVNTVSPDVAVVTRVALDHTEVLGDDLETVAREKAGIFRPLRPAVIGQADAPPALRARADAIGAHIFQSGSEFVAGSTDDGHWWWRGGQLSWEGLPRPPVPGEAAWQNAVTALAAFAQSPPASSMSVAALARSLAAWEVPGRLQRSSYASLEWVLDVAHNADGAQELADVLDGMARGRRCLAVFGVAARKAAEPLIAAVSGYIDAWYLPQLAEPDMRDSSQVAGWVVERGGVVARQGASVGETLAAVHADADEGDCVVVFGSFRTVAAVQAHQGWE